MSALIYATGFCNAEIVNALLAKENIDVNVKEIWTKKFFLIIFQIILFNIKIAKSIVFMVFSTDFFFNYTALHLASANGKIEMVKILLENPKIDVNIKCILKAKNLYNIIIIYIFLWYLNKIFVYGVLKTWWLIKQLLNWQKQTIILILLIYYQNI